MGRFAAFLPIVAAAHAAQAPAPAELPRNFSLTPAAAPRPVDPASSAGERPAYPTEQPQVPVNDALRPPQLLWNPTPASLVKLVPARVRYKLRF